MRAQSEAARREYRDRVVDMLRVFTQAIADDRQLIPERGMPARRVGGVTIIPSLLHDALCGWRVTSRMDAYPEFIVCGGCGLGFGPGPVHDAWDEV